jgi:protein tyrosine/serine phosphatase
MTENYKDKPYRPEISDDAQSVNFREIRAGQIAPNVLFRSSHPIQNDKQEPVIAMLASQYRIATVINLADTHSGLLRKSHFAPWYDRLFLDKKIIAVGMDFSITSDSNKQKLKKALEFIIRTERPYLIHCHAGVDRTGFVSMVLESLMGAAIDEISNDYLKSFNSTFESSIHEHSNKADSLLVLRLLSVMYEHLTITDQNLQAVTELYLKNTIGLSDEEISQLKLKLSC